MAPADDTTLLAAFERLFPAHARGGLRHAGRWVWGRPRTASAPAMVHVEVFPGDPMVNDLVMGSFTRDELRLGPADRRGLYRRRRVEFAAELNRRAVEENGLILLLRRDGGPTRRLRRMIRAAGFDAKIV